MASSVQNYSQSLISVLDDEKTIKKVKKQLDTIVKSLSDNESFYDLMSNPRLKQSDRHTIIKNVFDDVQPELLNTMLLLSDRGKFNQLPGIHHAYVAEYNKMHKQDEVTIESAYELSEEELNQIGQRFLDETGLERLIIDNKVNEDLIGGFKAFIGTKVYDTSIQTQLNDLKQRFKVRTNS